MRLRRVLGYAALGAGLVTTVDRGLRASAGVLEPPFSGAHHTARWRGLDVAYTEAGDPDDPTVVLLHGVNAAGSGGEFREVFADLAEAHHVVAPDLPGFGRSDRPPLTYSAAFYEEFVAGFLDRFDEPAVLASGLTAAYAVGAAARDGIAVDRLVLVCPTAVAGPEPPRPALRQLLRAPVIGAALFDLLVSKPSLRYFNADHGYHDPSKVSAEWLEYEWRTTHQENARFAPASFVSGHLNADLDPDLGATIAGLGAAGVETTLVWGREATVTPLADGRTLAERADVRLVVVDDAKLLPHVEFPVEFIEIARDALETDAVTGTGTETETESGGGSDDRSDATTAA
jgi:pimeloyl-ACP methyl ester carboxylesterase